MELNLDKYDYSAIRSRDLPYLEIRALEGRKIPIHSFHDGERWHSWVLLENGLLQPLRVYDFVETVYLAQNPVRSNDICFDFINFVYKHVEISQTRAFLWALRSDVFNLSASLKKLDLLQVNKDVEGISRMVATELEYLLIVCRSIFDLLQEISSKIWGSIELTDGSASKKNLPSSFRRIVLRDNKIQSSQDIQHRFGLPPSLAEWYSECALFFANSKTCAMPLSISP